MASKLRTRHDNVQRQLAWMEARGIIHTYSPPDASVSKYSVTMHEHGPHLGLTLAEAEAWVSGALTMWTWYSTRYSTAEDGSLIPVGE